jgi:hypothetical protein
MEVNEWLLAASVVVFCGPIAAEVVIRRRRRIRALKDRARRRRAFRRHAEIATREAYVAELRGERHLRAVREREL